MKKHLIALSLLCSLAACKKTSTDTNSNVLKIQVSNIGVYTNYIINPQNYTHTQGYVDIAGTKDTTYSLQVYSGDKLTILYNITYIPPKTDGFPGTGTIKFYYENNEIDAVSNGEGNIDINIPTK